MERNPTRWYIAPISAAILSGLSGPLKKADQGLSALLMQVQLIGIDSNSKTIAQPTILVFALDCDLKSGIMRIPPAQTQLAIANPNSSTCTKVNPKPNDPTKDAGPIYGFHRRHSTVATGSILMVACVSLEAVPWRTVACSPFFFFDTRSICYHNIHLCGKTVGRSPHMLH